jgi:hypothetical protein
MRMAFHMGQAWPYLRWPYQAKVMKMFEQERRRTVRMGGKDEV